MARDTSPVGDSGGAVLISSGITAIRITLHMTDQNRNITVKHIFIHVYRVTPPCGTQINHMFLILAVVADYLPAMPEFIKQLFPENRFRVALLAPGMKTVGNNKENVLFFHTCCVKFPQNIPDRKFPVTGCLFSTLYPVRHNDGHRASLMSKFTQCGHSDRVSQTFQVGRLQLFLGNIRRIFYRFPRNKNIRFFRKFRRNSSLSVFKLHFHICPSFLFVHVF